MAAPLTARDPPRNLDPPETSDRAGRERSVRTAEKAGHLPGQATDCGRGGRQLNREEARERPGMGPAVETRLRYTSLPSLKGPKESSRGRWTVLLAGNDAHNAAPRKKRACTGRPR